MTSSVEKRSTAGIIIIGDEILKGHTQDTNSFYLSQRLHSRGIVVEKISVIRDDVESIAQEIANFSANYTFVLTTGGIGPTHDDVTYAGVAKAFHEKLVENAEMTRILSDYQCLDDNCACALKLALVPESAKINYIVNRQTGEFYAYPLLSVKNVFIFPGVPEFLEIAFEGLIDLFESSKLPMYSLEMYLNQDEISVTNAIAKATNLFKGHVDFSCFSVDERNCFKVKLTIESESKRKAHDAFAFIQNILPPYSVIYYQTDAIANAAEQVYNVVEYSAVNSLTIAVRVALNIIEDCFDRFSLREICVSFNGGKDSSALLHLVHAVKQKKYPEDQLQAIYIRCLDPFPEIEQFIQQSTSSYHLKLFTEEGTIRDGLEKLIKENPHLNVILMASRRTDPHMSKLQYFQCR